MKQYVLLTVAISLSGCSIAHSVPQSPVPNRVEADSHLVTAFVDQNGTFYPREWQSRYGTPPKRGAYSLVTLAARSNMLSALRSEEAATLRAFSSYLANFNRIVILIHGYNNSEEDASHSFIKIRDRIAFKETDATVQFYWDGLVASGAGGGKIWFNATGYSQLAGSKGLRQILNGIHHKDIIIITHSRGASVLLSALSDPPYNPKFAADTRKFHNVDVYDQPALAANSNRIRVIMLAPAIGLIDFETPERDRLRRLDPQVERLDFTVNPKDPVLRKFVGRAGYFNPTDLGTDRTVAEQLASAYPNVHLHDVLDLKSHKFDRYVDHPVFVEMLRAAGVDTR